MANEPATKSCDVLIVSAGVGAGHNQAARAIADGLTQGRPGLAVETLDVLTLMPKWFSLYYSGGFKLCMTRMPWIYGIGFWMTNRPQTPRRSLAERFRLAREWSAMEKFRQFVIERQPKLIINTHFLTPPAVARMAGEGQLNCPQFVTVTDNDVHRWWYSQGVDRYFVPAQQCVDQIARWGIPRERITFSGMPIHPKWTLPLDRAKILADWRLPADKQLVLLTGGTEFTCGPIVKIANRIFEDCPNSTVVVLAGRNKQLLADLSTQPLAGERLFPQGFTDKSHELVEVCSVMITKAGGITTAECLSKGVPMILLNPVPGQEGGNARFFVSQGAAVVANSPDDVIAALRRILGDRGELAMMSSNAKRLYQPGTQTIVESALKIIDGNA